MRGQRSLVNTFPFNTQEQHQHGDHHAHDHGDHADHAATSVSSFNRNQLPNRGSRQVLNSKSLGYGCPGKLYQESTDTNIDTVCVFVLACLIFMGP